MYVLLGQPVTDKIFIKKLNIFAFVSWFSEATFTNGEQKSKKSYARHPEHDWPSLLKGESPAVPKIHHPSPAWPLELRKLPTTDPTAHGLRAKRAPSTFVNIQVSRSWGYEDMRIWGRGVAASFYKEFDSTMVDCCLFLRLYDGPNSKTLRFKLRSTKKDWVVTL